MGRLEEIFSRLSPLAYSVSFSILKSREEAEDVVQELFIKKIPSLLEKQPHISLEEVGRFMTVAARNLSIDNYRRNKKQTVYSPDFHTQSNKQPRDNLDLQFTLEKLDPIYSEVLTFKYLWGMTWTEVSSKIGLSTQGVRKRAAIGLKKVRSLLGGSETNE